MILTSEVTDVLGLAGIKEQVADGCNERIDTKSEVSENKVRPCS